MILAAVFDFCDGLAARLLKAYSEIGKELDSLADDVSFGVLPAVMLYQISGTDIWILKYLPLVLAAFSALRLAKFNLDERQTTSFIGLPTPANALFWASLIVGGGEWYASSPWMIFAILAGICLASWLLIAEIPMFALKFKHWGWAGNEVKYIFIITCIPLLLIFRVAAFAVIIAWYVLLSVYVNRKK